ncbi:histidine kinase [Spirosoma daeguense]
MNRAKDTAYTSAMARQAHSLLRIEKLKPHSPLRDTTILRLYNYLGALYRETREHKDSCLYYGKKMVEYASYCRNLEFKIKGLFQQSFYYRNIKVNLEEALRINLNAYALMQQANHDPQVFWRICYNIGELYANVREYQKSTQYYLQADTLIQFGTGMAKTSTEAYKAAILQGIAVNYTRQQAFGLAEIYFLRAVEKYKNINYKASHAFLNNDFSGFYQTQLRYRESITYGKQAEKLWLELEQTENLSMTQANLALCYAGLNMPDSAAYYAQYVLNLPKIALTAVTNAHKALYQVEMQRSNWQRSLIHYEKYISLRDSLDKVFNQQETYKIQSRFDLEQVALKNKQAEELQRRTLLALRQQNELTRLRSESEKQRLLEQATRDKLKRLIEIQQLQHQQTRAQVERTRQQHLINKLTINELNQNKTIETRTRNMLVLGLVLAFVVGLILLNYNRILSNRNNELRAKNELIEVVTHKAQAIELAALRSQMNPHFIFNCLNSIQYFTAQNNAEKASAYLTKFSRLIRLVLENSKSDRVTLTNELETLRLYIEMEVMRFPNKLHYQIQTDSLIDTDNVLLPPLLLQPYVENAIWHGLMHKEEGGTVWIAVSQNPEKSLQITITDNGVGRQKAAEFKSKSATRRKSFGMKITADRIALINQLYQIQTNVVINDLTNQKGQPAGTKVTLRIPI